MTSIRHAASLVVFWLASSMALHAQAQDQSAIAAGVVAGNVASEADEAPIAEEAFPGALLEDWSDARSGGTTRMTTSCEDVVLEGTLSGSYAYNYLTIAVLNASDTPVTVLPDRASVRFESGMRRRLIGGGNDTKLDPRWRVTRVFQFPKKGDFDGQRWFDVDLEIKHANACTLTLRFERNPNVRPLMSSHSVYTSMEVELGFGTHFGETGGQRKLDDGSGFAFHLDVLGFASMHHGFSFHLISDLHDDSAAASVRPDLAIEGRAHVETTGFMIGYVGRVYLTPWLTVIYNVATGPYITQLTDESKDNGVRLTRAVFPLRHRLRLAANVLSFDDGGCVGLGVSLIQTLVPYGTFGTVHLAGSSMSLTVDLFGGL